MLAKKINYLNEKVENKFLEIFKDNRQIEKTVRYLQNDYVGVVFTDITNYAECFIVTFQGENFKLDTVIDKLGNIISISYSKDQLQEYKGEKRKVITKEDFRKIKEYLFFDQNNSEYNIKISSDKNIGFSGKIIDELLDESHSIISILDIYYYILKALNNNTKGLVISIKSRNNENYLLVCDGIVIKYQNTKKLDDYHEMREYLNDGKLYLEKIEKYELIDHPLVFTKKK